MKHTLVIFLTAGVFQLPVFAGDPAGAAADFQKNLDAIGNARADVQTRTNDLKKAQQALKDAELAGASDLPKKQEELNRAREALMDAERRLQDRFKETQDALKQRRDEVRKAVPRREVYQAVVDGVRYSMLLHMPGGAPESLIAKKDDGTAKPDPQKPSATPLPDIGVKKRGFLFEPVR